MLEHSIMFRCGWQAFASSSAVILALGPSCSSDGSTDDLFPSGGTSGGRPNGGTAGMTAPGGSASGGRPALGGSGGTEADGGEPLNAGEGGSAITTGGRAPSGGRVGGGPGGAPGGRPGGGRSGGGVSGAQPGSGGSFPDDGGSGGAESPVSCDDNDPCTVDEPNTDGGCHHTPKCLASAACEVATCDANSGDCTTSPAEDGASCDDAMSCTSADVCVNGSCQGVSSDLVGSNDEARAIPDGNEDCGGNQPLIVDFNLSEGGAVTAVELKLDLEHPNLSHLKARLLHVASGREAVLFDIVDADGVDLIGEYVFSPNASVSFVDAAAVATQQPVQEMPPDIYLSQEDLATFFDGVPAEGTWRLSVHDLCLGDPGEYVDAELRVERACEPP
jgi:subtilisin-like proprotein convertase family protein